MANSPAPADELLLSAGEDIHRHHAAALRDLGVFDDRLRDAALADGRTLDDQGYVILRDLVDQDWLGAVRERLDHLAPVEPEQRGPEFHREQGTKRLGDLVNKGEIFDRAWTHPRLLALVARIIGRPFKLSALSAREALAGQGRQDLHIDWNQPRAADDPWHVAIGLWAIDGIDPDNGAPRLVPGSHRRASGPSHPLEDRGESIVPHCPAGSLLMMNSHLWHGGTANRSGRRRRLLHSYFTAREFPQQLVQREYIRKSTWDRLTPAHRWLLDA